MTILKCKSCGCDVERNIRVTSGTCFDCKKKRVNENTRKYLASPKYKNRIRKLKAKKKEPKEPKDPFSKWRNKKAT